MFKETCKIAILALFLLLSSGVPSKAQMTYIEPYNELRNILQQWNQAINDPDEACLAALYVLEVNYYGQKFSLQKIAESKKSWLLKHPDFLQYVDTSYIKVGETEPYKTYWIEYEKASVEKEDSIKVTGILEFAKVGNKYKITGEIDLITRATLAKRQPTVELPVGKTLYDYSPEFLSDTSFTHRRYRGETYRLDFKKAPSGEIRGEFSSYNTDFRSWFYAVLKYKGKSTSDDLIFRVFYKSSYDDEWEDFKDENVEIHLLILKGEIVVVKGNYFYIELGRAYPIVQKD